MGTCQNVAVFCWRGGNWGNGSNAGVFNVNFNDPRTNANRNNGGRLACT